MADAPSTNGPQSDGRHANGRFAKGNPGGPGNPGIGELAKLRADFIGKFRTKDNDLWFRTVRGILESKIAKDADKLKAAEMLSNRIAGPVGQQEILDRIEALEQLAASNRGRNGSN